MDFQKEWELWKKGFKVVAGIDEAGRGAWAGPVAAAAVAFPPDLDPEEAGVGRVMDSKRLTPSVREALFCKILQSALAYGIGFASQREIDEIGIVPATRLAMMRAVRMMRRPPDFLLLDYMSLPELPVPSLSIPRADSTFFSVAAASIVAKVARDRLMVRLGERYPGYSFASNKGYGTSDHREAVRKIGVSPAHRLSFEPMRTVVVQRGYFV
jgi:ribonuclease HII